MKIDQLLAEPGKGCQSLAAMIKNIRSRKNQVNQSISSLRHNIQESESALAEQLQERKELAAQLAALEQALLSTSAELAS